MQNKKKTKTKTNRPDWNSSFTESVHFNNSPLAVLKLLQLALVFILTPTFRAEAPTACLDMSFGYICEELCEDPIWGKANLKKIPAVLPYKSH